ncbi:PTS transporter subunit EIIC, partial [Photobacterium damselae subsp. damselae]|nr:PTS transporter subunit EIIC [Photobacterium damselae subsp. damselae]
MSQTAKKTTIWEFFQSLGKTFMLPVALLAFSGILLGIGSSLSSGAVKESLPFLDNTILQLIFMWMTKIGLVAFIYLPVMFAV